MAFLLTAGMAFAADKEVKGTVVKVDVAAKKLWLKTEAGDKEYEVSAETKFLGPKGGVSADGIKDARLVKGAALKLLVAGNNKTLREVHLPTTGAAEPKTPSKPEEPKKKAEAAKKAEHEAVKKTEAPKVASTQKPAPAKVETPAKPAPVADAKKAATEKTEKPAAKKADAKAHEKAAHETGKTAADAPGTKGKIVKVDAEHKTILVTTDDGKKLEVQVGDGTKFVGPRGGVSKQGLKDDRLAVGAEVRLVVSGKEAKEVHLPYRPRKTAGKDDDE